ncbi:MAG: glycosyltransferase [Bacteroidetes bacterium]|nr:glycosyltransferase [Bacteroidota bacterium]
MAIPKLSLIISVYKDVLALDLILRSVHRQSYNGELEVIIAEDCEGEEIKTHIKEWRSKYPFNILHIHQPDIGFRKCKVLNEAIRKANSDYLLFIDGDCILHKHLIKEHLLAAQKGHVVYGRRVMLSEFLTKQFLASKNFHLLNFVILFLTGCKRLDAALYYPFSKPKLKIGFWGHNWSIYKDDIKLVGGFDETYEQAGIGEDTDIEWRLQQKGIQFLRIKNKAIQYHLFHTSHYASTKAVEGLLNQKKQKYLSGDASVLIGSL